VSEPCASCGHLIQRHLINSLGQCVACRSAERIHQAYEARARAERAAQRGMELRAKADAIIAATPRQPDITRQ
jgi:hypothetical protein